MLFAAALVLLVAVLLGLHMGASTGPDPRAITVQRIRIVEDALDRYSVDNGAMLPADGESLPAKARQGLDALFSAPTQGELPPNWNGPYLRDRSVLQDGWGRPLRYVSPGAKVAPDRHRPYELWSWGSDNRPGGHGQAADMRSWEPETLISDTP